MKTFDAEVLFPPIINDTASSDTILQVSPMEQLQVECAVDSNPKAEISWLKDDTPLEMPDSLALVNDNRTLWIRRAELHDEGRYVCRAENPIGNVSRSFLVQITQPPMLDLGPSGKEEERVTVLIGGKAVLKCKLLANPAKKNESGNSVLLQWTYNNKPLESSRRSAVKVGMACNDRYLIK